VLANKGTAQRLSDEGIVVTLIKKMAEGHPNLIDCLKIDRVQSILYTPRANAALTDEGKIGEVGVQHGVPCITTLAAVEAAVGAMKVVREMLMDVLSQQHRDAANH
jgi:carbamoyl-phosphate synthase large subunit